MFLLNFHDKIIYIFNLSLDLPSTLKTRVSTFSLAQNLMKIEDWSIHFWHFKAQADLHILCLLYHRFLYRNLCSLFSFYLHHTLFLVVFINTPTSVQSPIRTFTRACTHTYTLAPAHAHKITHTKMFSTRNLFYSYFRINDYGNVTLLFSSLNPDCFVWKRNVRERLDRFCLGLIK